MARKLLYGHDSNSSPLSTMSDSLPLFPLHGGYVSDQNEDECDGFPIDAEDPFRHPIGITQDSLDDSSTANLDSPFLQTTASSSITAGIGNYSSFSLSSRTWLWGRLVLVSLAVVYGSLNVSMRMVFARPDPPTPSISSAIQGWFAVLGFVPLLWWEQRYVATHRSNYNDNVSGSIVHLKPKRNPNRAALGWFALELALWNFGTQALINTSLLVTHGARASFLVATSVVWTPLLSSISSLFLARSRNHNHNETKPTPPHHRRRTVVVWMACVLALAGTWILSQDESGAAANDAVANDASEGAADDASSSSSSSVSLSPAWGDACCLLAAICWSLYICRLSAKGDSFDETTTQLVKNTILAILYSLWMLASLFWHNRDGTSGALVLWKGWKDDPVTWGILFYTAIGPCTIADVCQQKAQALVPAAETNVLLSLEPVFAALLGFWILGECPSRDEATGGFSHRGSLVSSGRVWSNGDIVVAAYVSVTSVLRNSMIPG